MWTTWYLCLPGFGSNQVKAVSSFCHGNFDMPDHPPHCWTSIAIGVVSCKYNASCPREADWNQNTGQVPVTAEYGGQYQMLKSREK